MFNSFQQTINSEVKFEGIGLHSGKTSKVRLVPANKNSGVVFKRIDLKNNNIIQANYKNVSSATLCTTLENKHGTKVSTVEHLLAALCIKGIDNVLVEIDNEEVPIMDGSSKCFLEALDETSVRVLSAKKKYLKVNEELTFKSEKKIISIKPYDSFRVRFELDYKNPIIGNQSNTVDFGKECSKDVTNSRTFCLYEDIEKIKKMGLAKGGSLENAVVVQNNKVLNEEGLRNKKEFVNHKILDLVGDFFLSGYNFLCEVNCIKGGHNLSNLFLRDLLDKNVDKFEIIEFDHSEDIAIYQKNYHSQIAINS